MTTNQPPSDLRRLDKVPSIGSLFAKALLGAALPSAKNSGKELPSIALEATTKVDNAKLAAYCDVTGFTLRDTLPPIYPNALAFPLHMALLTDRSFPFAAMGIVHIENRVTQLRPIHTNEELSLCVYAANLRSHAKGRQFEVITETRVGDEIVNRAKSTYLRRRGPKDRLPQEAAPSAIDRPAPEALPVITTWTLPGDLGRRYAAVTGDRNPIHMYKITAKAFGFPRAIAHGMWTKARCIAALEARLPDAHTIEVSFRKPVLLPAKVAFRVSEPIAGTIDFAATHAQKESIHLLGRCEAI